MIFCEQNRRGPMAIQRKAIQRKESDWLLLVTVYVAEMVPTNQKTKDGSCMEVKKPSFLSSTMFRSSSFLLISNWTTIFDWIDYDDAIIDQSNAYGKILSFDFRLNIHFSNLYNIRTKHKFYKSTQLIVVKEHQLQDCGFEPTTLQLFSFKEWTPTRLDWLKKKLYR